MVSQRLNLALSSVLWRCFGRQEGHPACKNWVVGACVVVCPERCADLHIAQLMPLPLTLSCFSKIQTVFTGRCYASAVLAMALCLSLCSSVTSRCSTKTATHRITQATSHDSPGTLVLWSQRSPRNSTGVTPYEGAKYRWDGSKSATFDK